MSYTKRLWSGLIIARKMCVPGGPFELLVILGNDTVVMTTRSSKIATVCWSHVFLTYVSHRPEERCGTLQTSFHREVLEFAHPSRPSCKALFGGLTVPSADASYASPVVDLDRFASAGMLYTYIYVCR